MSEKAKILNPGEGLDETLGMKLAKEYFGGFVRVKQSSITITNVTVPIVQNNPDRIGLEIINNSALAVEVGFTADTSATEGVVLSASGGAFILKFRDDGQGCGNQVFGFGAVGGSSLTIIETILWGK